MGEGPKHLGSPFASCSSGLMLTVTSVSWTESSDALGGLLLLPPFSLTVQLILRHLLHCCIICLAALRTIISILPRVLRKKIHTISNWVLWLQINSLWTLEMVVLETSTQMFKGNPVISPLLVALPNPISLLCRETGVCWNASVCNLKLRLAEGCVVCQLVCSNGALQKPLLPGSVRSTWRRRATTTEETLAI